MHLIEPLYRIVTLRRTPIHDNFSNARRTSSRRVASLFYRLSWNRHAALRRTCERRNWYPLRVRGHKLFGITAGNNVPVQTTLRQLENSKRGSCLPVYQLSSIFRENSVIIASEIYLMQFRR